MRAGRALRDQWHGDRLYVEKCPRCGHEVGGHRGLPGECIECECVIQFADLDRWRAEGRLSR